MAKVTPLLWKHKENADGHHPIWLRFCDTHRTLYASLSVYIAPRFWNERKQEVRKGHPHRDRINQLIAKRLSQAEDERLRLLIEGEAVTAEALKSAVVPDEAKAPACFLRFARTKLEEVERRGNVSRYRREGVVMNKLESFAGPKGGTLPFESITPDFLRRFESYLIEKLENKASTVQSNLNIVRSHYRRAIREGVVPRESDPFFAYSPPKAKKAARHKLTEKELAALEALDLGGSGPVAPLIARVRDAFLFALYGAGIRFADVARLRCGNLAEETVTVYAEEESLEEREVLRLTYTMGKTGKRVSLQLIPQAERIARAYLTDEAGQPKPADMFLFPMLTGYDLSTPRQQLNATAAQNTVHNKYLKKIAERAEVGGTLSFHVARHSFADLARRRGWDVYAISKALAHSSLAITERYLAGSDAQLVDARMDQLFGSE